MENYLGRLLDDDEVVHHIDKNKHNNDINNLELMLSKEHVKCHATKGRKCKIFVCPNCGKEFKKELNHVYEPRKYGPFCSRKCNGQYNRKLYAHKGSVSEQSSKL